MKKTAIIYGLLFWGVSVFAQQHIPVDAGSDVKFSIKNFGLSVTGTLKGLQGKIIFDPANPPAASFNVTVDVATINTGNGARDKHLKKEDYFDEANHPKITFISSKVTGKAGTYTVVGQLNIKGISKQITFPFTATAGKNSYQFAGQFTINRRDFKVGGSSWVLSDELTVTLNISAINQ